MFVSFVLKTTNQEVCSLEYYPKSVIYDLMTDLGLTPLLMIVVDKKYEADVICREIKSVKAE